MILNSYGYDFNSRHMGHSGQYLAKNITRFHSCLAKIEQQKGQQTPPLN